MERVRALRKEIDRIDEQILLSLNERVKVCRTIGTTKQEHRIPIRDPKREEEQYKHVMKRASELGLNPDEAKAVYREIIAMCVHAQNPDSLL